MTVLLSVKPLVEQINLNVNLTENGYSNAAYNGDIEKNSKNINGVERSRTKKVSLTTRKISIPDIIKSADNVVPYTGVPLRTGKNVWKNLLVISSGFFFLFVAFSALSDLQSSLNPDEGLGTISLSVIYAALIFSCLFIPSLVISKLGCKWTLVFATFMYSSFAAANFYPVWETLLPSSVIVGLASAPLWSAKCTYLTQMGAEYAAYSGKNASDLVVRLFGFFFMILQCGRIVGNLISSLVLNQADSEAASEEQLNICGANYCNEPLPVYPTIDYYLEANTTNGTSIPPVQTGKDKLYVLCGIYLGCALLAGVIHAVGVDPLLRPVKEEKKESNRLALLIATIQQIRKPKQMLMIPITIYCGLQQGFIAGDFTKAFVTCPLGIDKVGFVMVCFCTVDAVCSSAFSPIVKKYGRVPVYLLAAITNVSIVGVLFNWRPNPNEISGFFILAALWGMTDAIWLTQNNAFYGVAFKDNEEAAFSNYLLWESTGFIISFAYSNYICMFIKLYILLAMLALGMAGYLTVEFIIWKEKNVSNED